MFLEILKLSRRRGFEISANSVERVILEILNSEEKEIFDTMLGFGS